VTGAARAAATGAMHFGLQFFPDAGPDEKSAAAYWNESLDLIALCDELGLSHVRTVEHYFTRYGGYSPNPIVFLAAASQRTARARLVTGAILPIFNHPLKMAGEIGMLDAISKGRMEVGFARAFLPHEFRRFGRSLDESRARFDEGVAQVRLLLEEEHASAHGQFHSFEDVTSLPRPVQLPRPPFWVASTSSPDSFVNAGRNGYWLMSIPRDAAKLRELVGLYRQAWRDAGHPGDGWVMMTFQMYCAHDSASAIATYREPVNRHLRYLADAASDWERGTVSKDYPNHPKMLETMRKTDFDGQRADNIVWVGSPGDIRDRIEAFAQAVGGFDVASLQVNSWTLPRAQAEASIRLFAEKVAPHFVERRRTPPPQGRRAA
jgi:alkanesulfonate monooxygenase SsuD/methylene tetrahydromethanopterin reductase-like flavin-dependent oxidoreductase (luciferase family)